MQLKIKAFSLSLVMVAGSLSPAWAERVMRVSVEQAVEGNVPITVHVEGGGVLVDFAPTGERITKISIDDPSRVVVDHCLVTKSCSEHPSPIIRLFRSAGINFQDIPTAKTTMLSVETIDEQGNYHSYPFPVTIGMGRSLISKILIGDQASDSLFNSGTVTRNTVAPTTVALGVEEAESKSFLIDPQLKRRIRNYLALIESGMNSKKAANRAGISTELANRLVQLGQARVLAARADAEKFYLLPTLPIVTYTPPEVRQPAIRTQNVHKLRPAIAKQTPSTALLPAAANPTPPTTVRPKNKTQNVRESRSAIALDNSSIAPLPKSPVVADPKPTYKPAKNHLQANALVRGLVIAKRQKKISYAIAAKVQDVIDNLRAGKDIATAAKRSGVRIDKINELLTLAGR